MFGPDRPTPLLARWSVYKVGPRARPSPPLLFMFNTLVMLCALAALRAQAHVGAYHKCVSVLRPLYLLILTWARSCAQPCTA